MSAVDVDDGGHSPEQTPAEKAKKRMHDWYVTRGKAQRRGRQQCAAPVHPKRRKPNAPGDHEPEESNPAAYFGDLQDESGSGSQLQPYQGIFSREEIETIKDIIYDYFEEKPEKSSVMGGVVSALGAAAVPALLKTAFDAGTITTAKSFLKTRVWDWSAPPSTPLSTPSAGESCVGVVCSSLSTPEPLPSSSVSCNNYVDID